MGFFFCKLSLLLSTITTNGYAVVCVLAADSVMSLFARTEADSPQSILGCQEAGSWLCPSNQKYIHPDRKKLSFNGGSNISIKWMVGNHPIFIHPPNFEHHKNAQILCCWEHNPHPQSSPNTAENGQVKWLKLFFIFFKENNVLVHIPDQIISLKIDPFFF